MTSSSLSLQLPTVSSTFRLRDEGLNAAWPRRSEEASVVTVVADALVCRAARPVVQPLHSANMVCVYCSPNVCPLQCFIPAVKLCGRS